MGSTGQRMGLAIACGWMGEFRPLRTMATLAAQEWARRERMNTYINPEPNKTANLPPQLIDTDQSPSNSRGG